MGQGAGRTHPGHQRALQEELHELRNGHVHAEAAPAGSTPRSPAPRHKAAPAASSGRGAAAASTRETKAGREPTFRGFGGPAPRPGLGEGEGPPLGAEQCGRQPRPSEALSSRRAASRCRGLEPGCGRGCAGLREGAADRTCAGGGGLRAASLATCTWGRRHAPTLSAASALGVLARGVSLRACVCGGPGR